MFDGLNFMKQNKTKRKNKNKKKNSNNAGN
jgi:hypothetical protein